MDIPCVRTFRRCCGEAELLLRLCRALGLDYGELDVLRDVEDGKLYVVDVNNTPWAPPIISIRKTSLRH